MSFKCVITGLPNVGKSTLFKALTKINVRAENFPFCTIESNIGSVPIFDNRLYNIAKIFNSKKILFSTIKFIDIAGLVKGASKGIGLGNKFLTDIRKADIIIHVVRCFQDDNIIHILNKIDPIKDIQTINDELTIFDFNICENVINNIYKKNKKSNLEKTEFKLNTIKRCLFQLENTGKISFYNFNKKEIELINYLNLITTKPVVYVANIHKDLSKNDPYLDKIFNFAKKKDFTIVPVYVLTKNKFEINNNLIKKKENKEFIQKLNSKELNINNVIQAVYKALNLQTYFTVEKKQACSWNIPIGSNILSGARKIHTDFEKGFICAQIIPYKDFINYKNIKEIKLAGKIRTEGKDYIIKDGDIVKFLFNV